MITRRDSLKLGLAAGAGLAWPLAGAGAGEAGKHAKPITRDIPSSGQRLPVVGLGSSATFAQSAGQDDLAALRAVFEALVEHGGAVFDTAPSYGDAEAVAGRIVQELGIAKSLFWATKLNVAGRGGGQADVAAARRQLEASFERLGQPVIDLIQVHNLGDVATQLPLLRGLKDAGRIRYLGLTTTFERQYEALEQWMRREPLDFIGVDYAIDNRAVEERLLPLARDRGIAVLCYAPFGRTRLWSRVRGQALPAWAADVGARSWAQFFLKFVIANPTITAATPATSQARHMIDNMGAAFGELPDDAMRRRMVEYVRTLS